MSNITVSKGGSSHIVLNYLPEILERFIHPTEVFAEVHAASFIAVESTNISHADDCNTVKDV